MSINELSYQLLRDVEHIALGVLAMGLLMHMAWRFYVRPFSANWGEADGEFSKRAPLWGKVRSDMFQPLDLVMVFLILTFYYLKFLPTEANLDPSPDDVPSIQLILAQFVISFFMIVFALSLLYFGGRRNPNEVFGLNCVSLRKWVLWVLVVGVPLIALILGLHYAVTTWWLEPTFGQMENQEAVNSLLKAEDPMTRTLLVIYACLVAPFVEEVLFRGYLYGVVKRYTGPLFSMVVVGLLFAAIHLNVPAMFPLWVFSIALVLSYELSGSLWVPVGIHALFNGFNVWLMFHNQGVVS